jgi:hypothetical protein
MYSVILERSDHFETGTVTHVSETRIPVAPEISLKNVSFSGPIENGAPRFQFANAGRRLFRMKLCHTIVVHVLAASHGVGEMNFPVVRIINGAERGGDTAFGHYGVSFTKKGFTYESDFDAGCRCFYCRSKSGSAGTNDQNIVFEFLIFGH